MDINDLTIVLSNFGKTTGMSWETGDFNGDGTVDINDLTIVLASFGETAGSAVGGSSAVPKPVALRSARRCLLAARYRLAATILRGRLTAGAAPGERLACAVKYDPIDSPTRVRDELVANPVPPKELTTGERCLFRQTLTSRSVPSCSFLATPDEETVYTSSAGPRNPF